MTGRSLLHAIRYGGSAVRTASSLGENGLCTLWACDAPIREPQGAMQGTKLLIAAMQAPASNQVPHRKRIDAHDACGGENQEHLHNFIHPSCP